MTLLLHPLPPKPPPIPTTPSLNCLRAMLDGNSPRVLLSSPQVKRIGIMDPFSGELQEGFPTDETNFRVRVLSGGRRVAIGESCPRYDNHHVHVYQLTQENLLVRELSVVHGRGRVYGLSGVSSSSPFQEEKMMIGDEGCRFVSCGYAGKCKLWCCRRDSVQMHEFRSPATAFSLATHSHFLYVAGSIPTDIMRSDMTTGKLVCEFVGHTRPVWGLFAGVGEYENLLFSNSFDRSLRSWDVRTPGPRCVVDKKSSSQSLHCAFDKHLLFCDALRRHVNIEVYDLRMMSSLLRDFRVHQDRTPRDISRISEDLFVSASEDGTVSVWKSDGLLRTIETDMVANTGCAVVGEGVYRQDSDYFQSGKVVEEEVRALEERVAFWRRLTDGWSSSMLLVVFSSDGGSLRWKLPLSIGTAKMV